MSHTIQLSGSTITLNDKPLFTGVAEGATLEADPLGVGAFLTLTAAELGFRLIFPLGELSGVSQFTALHRYDPFWMTVVTGRKGGEIPIETQFLLAKTTVGGYLIFAPLLDGSFRASLQGVGESGVELVAESGDPATLTKSLTGLFIAGGDDPYVLIEAAARSVATRLGAGRLRVEKGVPAFIDQFGWCTWDAFYQEVSQEKVKSGLESFAAGGVNPKMIILDDGWLSERTMPTGEQRLTSFAANDKFEGLAPTIAMAKGEFDIETFIVWHAVQGYWGGVDGDALPGYDVHAIAREFSQGIVHHAPAINSSWGSVTGVVAPERLYKFYQDFHRELRWQGVDGVKVDNQASIEGMTSGIGGRVSYMRAVHEALEGSVQTHFQGALINCMSCSTDMMYSAINSNLTRTSTDFWPDTPSSHGLHLFVNAQVSNWFGEFIHPDWDMFQSGHAMGAYHAAGRAVGGCPIYVSDKPGAHDFDLLRKLVLSDGTTARALQPGKPTLDCLFSDVTKEDVLLKIFNLNVGAGVIGAFHARYAETGTEPITGTVSPADVIGLEGDRFIAYAHYAKDLRLVNRNETWDITLPQLTAEVFTFVPIDSGFAPLGFPGLFNSAGVVTAKGWIIDSLYELTLRTGGEFQAHSEKAPSRVEINGTSTDFNYDAAKQTLSLNVSGSEQVTVRVWF